MRLRLFYHSILSDWNHGNAHFLRGVVWELMARGHDVTVYEPQDGWSLSHLLDERGEAALAEFRAFYPNVRSHPYALEHLDLETALDGADVVIVHEWSAPELIARVGEHRKRGAPYRLLFHDTHHRLVTRPDEMRAFDLSGYDAVLAFGEVLSELYRTRSLCERVFTWHEAADTRVFHPHTRKDSSGLVWIGNWGDDERTQELREFLLEPIRALRLPADIYGVRYPAEALCELEGCGAEYRGFLPNVRVPEVFAQHALTVHVPRRPYVEALIGVPTIRVFEAMACGIPLVCAPWRDVENLFTAERDYLQVSSGQEMTRVLRSLLHEPAWRDALSKHALATIRERHTCAHRVDELFAILRELGSGRAVDFPAQGQQQVTGGIACRSR